MGCGGAEQTAGKGEQREEGQKGKPFVCQSAVFPHDADGGKAGDRHPGKDGNKPDLVGVQGDQGDQAVTEKHGSEGGQGEEQDLVLVLWLESKMDCLLFIVV